MSKRTGEPMRRAIAVLMALMVVGVAGLSDNALAATLPKCPANTSALEVNVPEYARAGQGVEVSLETFERQRLSEVQVSLLGLYVEQDFPVLMDRNRVKIVSDPGPPEPQLSISTTWTQDADSLAACRGSVRYVLRVIPSNATAGYAILPRLFGSFHVRPVNPSKGHKARTWRFRPRCRFFACNTVVRSTGGLKGEFRLRPNGGYELFKMFKPRGQCEVTRTATNPFTGEVISSSTRVIRKAFIPSQRIELRVTKGTGVNRVVSFEGTFREVFRPTRHAERRGCTRGTTDIERISGRLSRG